MASQNVSHLLGTLQEDPENQEALSAIAALAENGTSGLDADTERMLDLARRGHGERSEYRAAAHLLSVQAKLSADADPDRAANFYQELGQIYREELLDDSNAKGAFEQALALRPGDEDLQDQIAQIEQTAEKWSDIVKRFIDEANSASDPTLKSSLLVSAASLVWKYKGRGRDKQVDSLFKEALEAARGDARAARLYEQVLRTREKWEELAAVLLETAEGTRDKEEKVHLMIRAARVLANELGDKVRAAAAYERVLDFHPNHSRSMSFLVGYFMETKDWDHLVALYEDALRSRNKLDDEAGVLLQLGMVHWRFREAPDKAEPYFARLRKMDPAHPGMLDFYRSYLENDEDPQKLVKIFTDAQRGANSDEQRLALAIELAETSSLAGHDERAIDAWKTVLRLDPTNALAPRELRSLYERTEKWNALVEVLKAEADSVPDDEPERKVALLRELIPIYRGRLGLDVMVINTYNAILSLDPSDQEAIDALAETYESTNRWNDLIGVLTKQAEAQEDPAQQVELYLRVADLWIERFANYNQATQPLEQVIEIEPENRAALRTLKDIYTKKRAWTHLYDVLVKESRLASDPESRLAHKLELADLAGKRLHRHADAIQIWKEILEQAPDHPDALDNLQKLAEREKDWETLADVLERRVLESAADEKEQVKLLQKLGVIYGEHLEDTIKAASAWKRILDLDPKNGRALRTLRETFLASSDFEGLEALYADAGDYEGLVDVLGNVADRAKDDAVKVQLSFRAAEIYENELQQGNRAFRAYERVLSADPANERAARSLIPIYEGEGKHNRLPALYEVLYGHAEDDAGRLAILGTLRGLATERLSDDASAFDYSARAFALAPTDPETRASLERSAEPASRHEALVELYAGRLAAIDEDPDADTERLWLRRRIASIAGERLGQTDQAIAQLKQILEAQPDDAEAAEGLQQIYRAAGMHRDLRGLLLSRVSHATDEGSRRDLLGELARLEEHEIGDAESAAARYRQILESDPQDRGALAAIDRLGEAAGRWDEVADAIRRQREIVDDEAEHAALTLRLGQTLAGPLADRRGAFDAFSEVAMMRPEEARAVAGLEALLDDEELAPEVRLVLEDVYEATGQYEKLTAVIEQRLAASTDPDEQRALRMRYAELAGTIGDAKAAYGALEAAFLADPSNVELQDRVIEAAEAADEHESLAQAFSSAMTSLETHDQSALAAKVAHLYDVVLGRPDDAEPFYRKVLANDPLDEAAFGALKDLYTNAERWSELQVLYDRRIAETVDAESKLDLLLQVCFLFEELTDDAEAAITAHRQVLDLDPEHSASRRALERLFERTERWDDLVALLREELDRANPDEQIGLTQRLGMLHEKRLNRPEQAVDCYEAVLEREPSHRHARDALERLIAVPAQRQRCARILAPIYEDRGDWPELVDTLKVQLEEVPDVGDRVALLTRIAGLQEDRLHDPAAAFASIATAVEVDPAEQLVREELARLARMRDAERERAAVLEKAFEKSREDAVLACEILLELAQLWDDAVGDGDQAEAAYRRLIAIEPDDTEVLLEASRALERLHLAKGDHAALAEDLSRQVELETDPDTQGRLLVRLADLREELLEDVPGAIAAHRQRLVIDPGDVDAMSALERLYEQTAQWASLIEILRARDAVVTDVDEQCAIARRIGAIYEGELEDADNAIIAYNDVLARFGTDSETLASLSRLYQQAERWTDLLEVAQMVYEMAEQGPIRAAVRYQMGEIMRGYTGEVERAVEAYGEVLELVPDHPGALESLAAIMTADGTPTTPEVEGRDTLDDAEADGEEGEAREASEPSEPEGPVYPVEVRIEAARVLVPHFESAADYPQLLDALLVRAESEDPMERYAALRRAAEVADLGLQDASRSFELQGRAVRAGLAEDDLGDMLRELGRFAADSQRWSDYVGLLREVGPEVMDGDLQVQAYLQVAEVARDRLEDPVLARSYYENVLETQPDHTEALDALEELIAAAEDYPALLEVLRRKTDLADSPDERVPLLLRRAEIGESHTGEIANAIDCYEQALAETQPREAYEGLERLYGRAERYNALAVHYEKMLEDGVGEPVEVRYRLGVTQLEKLEDPWAATEQFREALLLDVEHQPTIEALERLMDDEEHRATAAEILEPVFLQKMDWPRVTACIEARLAAEADLDERKAHLTRLGQIHEDYLEDLEGALEAYARLFREDPRDHSTWETLSRLARVLERWDRLAEIYREALEGIGGDDEETARLALLTGQLYDDKVQDLAKAAPMYERALRFEPGNHDAFIALESVHQRREAWDDLLRLYRDQSSAAETDEERIAFLRKSARLLEEELAQPDRAIEAQRDILMIDPEDTNAIAALDELLVRQERWPEVADHLRHQIELGAGEPFVNDLKLRLGKLLKERLEDTAGAIDVFEEITEADPHHADTVVALEQLVQSPGHQTRIIEILEPIYRATDQWRKRIAIYEARVETTEEQYDRVRLLCQIAELHEERAGDMQLAFHAYARALAAAPEDHDVRGQVDRLAQDLGTWDSHVAAYEEALKHTQDATVQAELLTQIARVHDEMRGDPRSAIETYERLLEVDADDPTPLDSLESLHTMVGDWRGLVDVLQRKVERSYDPEERGELLQRAGSVLEELLGDQAGAIEAYRAALMENETDEYALEALDRLYEAAGDHEQLGDVLRRRLESEQDPETRVELALRFGRVNETHLRRPHEAIDAYRRALDDDPNQLEAIEALARLYEREAQWPDLLENLRLQAGMQEEMGRRVQLLYRAGEVLEREMDDVLSALPTYQDVLELDPRFEKAIQALLRIGKLDEYREQAGEIVEPLLRTQERWDELAELLAGKAQAAYDPADKRAELRRLAEVHELGRQDREAAFEAYTRALAEDPSDEQTAEDIERLAAELGAWERAADAFAVRASSALEPDVGRGLYGRLARIAEDHLGDDARAVEAYSRAIELGGDDDEALGALDRLYTKLAAWPELGEILDRRVQASMDPTERGELLVRLGTLKQEQFGDRQGAFRAFSEVLERDPSEARAVAAMESLLEDDSLAAEVVEVLEPVYRDTGATEKVAALYDVRIGLADTDGERVRYLQEQAGVYETELGDATRALEALRRAFDMDPRDETIAGDVERLAPQAEGGWESLRGLIERVLEAGGDDFDQMLVRDLNMRAARWYRDYLNDPEQAEARYRGAITADQDTQEAHEQLVELLRAPGREKALVAALVHWADVDYDEDAKKARLSEAAALAESAFNEPALAIRCYEKILEVDGTHAHSLDQLVRLEGDVGNHERVCDLLETRIEVEMDPDARLQLRKQLAATYATLERIHDSIEAWQGALDEVPDDLDAISALEGLYERTERWNDLEDLVQRRLEIARTPEESIAARVRLARLAESRFGRRDDAIDQLREILEEDRYNVEALDELERLHTVGEEWDELVALLERRIGHAQDSGDGEREIDLLLRLAAVQVEHRADAPAAVEIYQRVLARDPQHLDTLGALLALHRSSEDWAAAADVLERLGAVQSDEEAVATAYEVAELASEKLDDPGRAEAALRRAYELSGGSADSRDRLKAHYERHDQADQLAMMLAMDEEETEDPVEKVKLLKRIADLYSGPLGDPGSAAQYLERAAQLDPEDRDVLLPLCDLYIAAGRQSDAIPVLEQIVASYGTRRNKEVAVYHHRLGKAKESMGDLDGAMESYDAAFKVDLTNVVVLRDLGRLCMARGDLDRAQKTFRALLLQKLSDDAGITKADVYFHLGEISAKSGDNRKAISMLERAKAENADHAEAIALLEQLKG
ncbi:MAG: tetratricopeptide repeat protein [Sandaracinaceae bacterium]|nr:tetratricopeptide repeat protein [Sandaracinaceae bacterium]